MSEHEPEGPYVYQPHGFQDREHWAAGRIYALGGLPLLAKIDGLTKPEAEAVLAAFTGRIREQIAANVEALGCEEQWCGLDAAKHYANCPLSIAAAIREGRL